MSTPEPTNSSAAPAAAASQPPAESAAARPLPRVWPAAGIVVALVFAALAWRQHAFVDRYSVNVMFYDQWDFYTPIFQQGGWWKIFSWQHGPHRQGVGFLVTHLIDQISGWDSRWSAFTVSFTLVAAAVAALALARRCGVRGLACVAVPLLFFNLRQYEIFVGASNLSHGAMPVLLLVLYCLAWFVPRRPLRLGLLAALTFLLLFTGFGLFVGAITPLVLAIEAVQTFRSGEKAAAWQCAAALAAVAASWALFAHDYHFAPAVPNFRFPHERPLEYFYFVGLMLGNFHGVPGYGAPAIATGLVVAAGLAAIAGWHGWRIVHGGVVHERPSVAIFSLATFALLYCAFTAIGRVCLGVTNAPAASRYVTLMISGGLALWLHLTTLRRATLGRMLALAYTACLAVGTLALRHEDWESVHWYSDGRTAWRAAYFHTHDAAKANREAGFDIHPLPNSLADRLKFLEARRLNFFKSPPPTAATQRNAAP